MLLECRECRNMRFRIDWSIGSPRVVAVCSACQHSESLWYMLADMHPCTHCGRSTMLTYECGVCMEKVCGGCYWKVEKDVYLCPLREGAWWSFNGKFVVQLRSQLRSLNFWHSITIKWEGITFQHWEGCILRSLFLLWRTAYSIAFDRRWCGWVGHERKYRFLPFGQSAGVPDLVLLRS
jgi:hypothetical protein